MEVLKLFNNLNINNGIITINNETEYIENLFIHVSEYGDHRYTDLCIRKKRNKRLFGGTRFTAIPKSEIEKRIHELSNVTDIFEVKVEKLN